MKTTTNRGASPETTDITRLEHYSTDERECTCQAYKHGHGATCKHQVLLLSLLKAAIQYYKTTYHRCNCDQWFQQMNLDFKGRCEHQRACALSVEPENQKPLPVVTWERLTWLEMEVAA